MNHTVASDVPPARRIGWTYPSRSSVVSGERPSRGSAATTSARSFTALTSRPLAVPGWTPTPLIVSLSWYAENDSVSISPRPEPSNVYARSAPNTARSKWSVPLPTSSSTVKAIRAVARGASSRTSWATAVMIAATPALSSAPSSVVPSLVTRSCPSLSASAGISAGSRTWDGSPGRRIVSPAHARWTIGRTPVPGVSGVVSTCAISPTVGASGTVPGSVAKT